MQGWAWHETASPKGFLAWDLSPEAKNSGTVPFQTVPAIWGKIPGISRKDNSKKSRIPLIKVPNSGDFFGIFSRFLRDSQIQIPIPWIKAFSGFCSRDFFGIFWGFHIPIPGMSWFFDLARNKKKSGDSGFGVPKKPIPKPTLLESRDLLCTKKC